MKNLLEERQQKLLELYPFLSQEEAKAIVEEIIEYLKYSIKELD